MSKALVLSGAGRYADPWHSYHETTARILPLAHDAGWTTEVREDIDEALAEGLDQWDLLIVNASDSWHELDEAFPPPPKETIDQGRANLAHAFERGISVLAIHSSASTLRDYPQFRTALGGEWTPGKSWHPSIGDVHVRTMHSEIVEGLGDFTVLDERYTALTQDPGIEPLACCSSDNRTHLLVWANQYGTSRVIYSALGHDVRSYDSRGHRSLLRRGLSWLLPRPAYDD